MDSVFEEDHSLTIDQLYAGIEEHGNLRPHLVFACIDIIRRVSTREPKPKTLKKVSKNVEDSILSAREATPSVDLSDTFDREAVVRVDTVEGVSLFQPLVPHQAP
ncbi:hypothetical protein [Pyxidicoccus trucidator]|uniref:hypothetical protein n=1 Tax=Pyxidicoccus trucidator TaxID=2709662 RepID=UPI0013DC8DA2|nr:hypothetical protein [Pyxidicoccus trucidator]